MKGTPTKEVKILAVKQPWASLIVLGHQDVENRVWNTNYRGELYIHASVTQHKQGYRGYNLYEQLNGEPFIDIKLLPKGCIIGKVDLVDVVEDLDSPWFEGPRGLVFKNSVIFKYPEAHKGRLKIYTGIVTEDIR